MNARDVLKYGHLTVLGSIKDLPDADWTAGGVCGVWSTKEIIAHLTSYELVLIDILTSFTGGGPTPMLDEFQAGPGFNDAQVALRQGLSIAETLAEYSEANERVAALAGQIPEATWREVGTIPWYGDAYSLDDLMVYQYYGHKREHTAQIDAYRDRLARGLPTAAAAVH